MQLFDELFTFREKAVCTFQGVGAEGEDESEVNEDFGGGVDRAGDLRWVDRLDGLGGDGFHGVYLLGGCFSISQRYSG